MQKNRRGNSCCSQVTQRQHANILRNNSSSIYNVFCWQDDHLPTQQVYHRVNPYPINANLTRNQNNTTNRVDNIQSERYQDNYRKKGLTQQSYPKDNQQDNRKGVLKKSITTRQSDTIPKSVSLPKKIEKQQNQDQHQQKKQKDIENRKKVKDYVDSLVPFSRTLTNTKFQEYFGRAALQTYGRANTNQPIGGIIYGNHQKTFNINPHSYTNEPQYYQTHTTALNYGKRTKLNHEQKYTKLMRTLTKKLGLNDKNETLKQGKEVVYVDVNDDNMYEAMKENNKFIKTHRDQIRNVQNENKQKKQQEKQQQRQQFYTNKKNTIEKNFNNTLNQSTLPSTFFQSSDQERLNQQVIYRHHDQHGNVRLAADRHAITCYVDTNFPQNDKAYTQFLKSTMPIFPIPTTHQDRNLDAIREENYQKSLQIVYPSHYLLPNCQQPQILKMIANKVGRTTSTNSPQKNRSPKRGSGQNQDRKYIREGKERGRVEQRENQRRQLSKNREGKVEKESTDRVGKSNVDENIGKYKNTNDKNEIDKEQILRKAWESNMIANSILEKRKSGKSCCESVYLPNNEKNPFFYKMASDQIVQVPFAGRKKN